MSMDYALCKGTRKDGKPCTMPVNKVEGGGYCEFHVVAAFNRAQRQNPLQNKANAGNNSNKNNNNNNNNKNNGNNGSAMSGVSLAGTTAVLSCSMYRREAQPACVRLQRNNPTRNHPTHAAQG